MKDLEEMMNHYQINDTTPLGETPLSEHEKARLLQKTLEKAGLAPQKKISALKLPFWKKFPQKLGAMAAAYVLIFLTAFVSIAAIATDSDLLSLLRPQTEEQRLLLSQSGTVIDQKVSGNGLTIHVKEAIGDRHSLYILYDVIAPEGTVLDASLYTFQRENVQLIQSSWKRFFGGSGSGWYTVDVEDLDPGDNKISRILVYEASSKLPGNSIKIYWENFMLYDPTGLTVHPFGTNAAPEKADDGDDYFVLCPGEWTLEVPLAYQDQSVTYRLNQPVDNAYGKGTISSIQISPISVTLTLKLEEIYPDNPAPTQLNPFQNEMIEIISRNGDAIQFSSGSTSSNGRKIVRSYLFEQVMPWDEVESIRFAGITILRNVANPER